MSDDGLLSARELIELIKRNAAGKSPLKTPAKDTGQGPTDREGTPEHGWSEDLGDAVGLIRPSGTKTVVRKGSRIRRYNREHNTFTEFRVVDTPDGKKLDLVGCFFIKNPFVRDDVAERQRVAAYWAAVASGDVVLDERPGCHWCAYGVPVKKDPGNPHLFTTVVCMNRDIVAGLNPRERGEASMRCTPAIHFKPSGVHAFAAGYFGWKSDPDRIARMELMARPPRKIDVSKKDQSGSGSHTLAPQRHHGFWDDVDIVSDRDRPVNACRGAAKKGSIATRPRPQKRSRRR